MNFDFQRLLEQAINRGTVEDALATAYVHRFLGDECTDVLDMLGIGGRP